MARIYLGVGSNIDPEPNIAGGLATLKAHFGTLIVSSIYATVAVGFEGDEFYNLVVGFDSDDDVYTIVDVLKSIESAHGRTHDEPKYASRSLDLDLLTYDEQILHNKDISIPREDILKYAFVLKPLAEIAPETRHPQTRIRYRELWNEFTDKGAVLRDVSHLFERIDAIR